MDPSRIRGIAGFGLVEILMAITILSIVLLALGSLMFQAGRDMNRSGAVAYRSAAQLKVASWAQGLPWDSLHSPPGGPVGCITDTTGQLVYSRCTTLQTMTGTRTRITVAILPTGRLTANPDTVVIDRNRPLQTSPFH